MRRIDKLKEKLDKAMARQSALTRSGKLVESLRMNAVISAIEEEIAEARKYEPQQLGKLLDRETLRRMEIGAKLVEVHLAADYLADCAFDIRETLDKLGLADCSIFPMLRSIQRQAQEFADIVCHPEFAGLSDFMTTNDRFIDDMHLIARRYISEKLTLTDD